MKLCQSRNIFVRVAVGATDHFQSRAMEWASGLMLTLWGLILLAKPDFFEQTYAYHEINEIVGQAVWARLCLAFGIARLVALTINGTFWGTVYSRYSPHVRAATAFASCFFWLSISLALARSGITTGLAVYPVMLLFDIYNVYRASIDAGRSDGASASGQDT